MRLIITALVSCMVLLLTGQKNKQDLFCHRWLEIGYKLRGEKLVHDENPQVIRTIVFFQNNTFTEESYIEKAAGNWVFNADSTKFGMEYTLYNNQKIGNVVPISTTLLIIKLNEDTLIYGEPSDYGPTNKSAGYEDYYFVRQY